MVIPESTSSPQTVDYFSLGESQVRLDQASSMCLTGYGFTPMAVCLWLIERTTAFRFSMQTVTILTNGQGWHDPVIYMLTKTKSFTYQN